jgi:cytoskeletal protein CcmA (bactofilin family)
MNRSLCRNMFVKRCIALVLFAACFVDAFLFANEDDLTEEQKVIVLPAGTVYNGDYFAVGNDVEISGTVNGDVYVFAQQVIIDGMINGDVLGSGGSIDISGKVLRSCRLAAGQILISGEIGNNVTAIAGNLQLLGSSSIGGNLVAIAGNVDLAAKIGADATVMASNLRVSSQINKNLQGYVGQMRLTSKAFVGGDLYYRTNTPPWIEPGAVIRGTVTHRPTFVHELVKGTWIQKLLVGSKVLAILMNFLYTFVIGIVLIKLFPKNLEAATEVLKSHTFKAICYGIVLLVLVPLAALILLMTILGVPFALTLLAANVIGFYTAKVYTIFWASNWMFGKIGFKANRLPGFFCGLLLYFCLTAIPVAGTMLAFISMLLGLGAGVLSQAKRSIFQTQTSA